MTSCSIRLIAALCCCCVWDCLVIPSTGFLRYKEEFRPSVTIKVTQNNLGYNTIINHCGGNFVSNRTVVIAASCVAFENGTVFPNPMIDILLRQIENKRPGGRNFRKTVRNFFGRLASPFRGSHASAHASSVDSRELSIVVHPNFRKNSDGAFNDIALLQSTSLSLINGTDHDVVLLPNKTTEMYFIDYCAQPHLQHDGSIRDIRLYRMELVGTCAAQLFFSAGADTDDNRLLCGSPRDPYQNDLPTTAQHGVLICDKNGAHYLAGLCIIPAYRVDSDDDRKADSVRYRAQQQAGNSAIRNIAAYNPSPNSNRPALFTRVRWYIDWIWSNMV